MVKRWGEFETILPTAKHYLCEFNGSGQDLYEAINRGSWFEVLEDGRIMLTNRYSL